MTERRCRTTALRMSPTWRIAITTVVIAGASVLGGCSTSVWYNHFQGLQYGRCEKLADAEDRRRCKEATFPDQDRYEKEREAARGPARE